MGKCVVSFITVSGFGNFIIPLQIGARDMAYPFLNMLSYWIVVPASLIMLLSFFVPDGAAASGWTSYPPLSALAEAIPGSGLGQTLWILAMALFIFSFTMGALNYITTILNMRAPGMSMFRLPLTIWMLLISAIIGVLAFPALTAAAIMLLLDRLAATSFFLPEGMVLSGQVLNYEGGTPLLFQHLFWFLGHPEVYVLALPALGIAFDVLATFGRRPVFGYKRPKIVHLSRQRIEVRDVAQWLVDNDLRDKAVIQRHADQTRHRHARKRQAIEVEIDHLIGAMGVKLMCEAAIFVIGQKQVSPRDIGGGIAVRAEKRKEREVFDYNKRPWIR